MAAIWKGALSFGLVNIPVALQSAVRRADGIHFRQLDGDDLTPIKQQRVNGKTGDVVPWDRIVKGYEVSDGQFVVLSQEEFKSAALTSSKTIDIHSFVPANELDPRYFETAYYLVPPKEGHKAYALLREAITRTNMIGVGKITLRSTSQHLVAVQAVGEALVLAVIRFADEIVDSSEYSFPAGAEVRPQEVKMAEQLIANLAEPFDPGNFEDEYRANLMQIIEAKAKNETVSFAEQSEPEPTPVLDLVARLKESLQQTKGAARGKNAATTRAASAKKPSAAASEKSKAEPAPRKSAARKTSARKNSARKSA